MTWTSDKETNKSLQGNITFFTYQASSRRAIMPPGF